MKWARVTPKDPNPQDAVCFHEFPDLSALKAEMETPANAWTNYSFKPVPDFDSTDSYAAFRERYEIFCGGYLLYYDDQVRNQSVDHSIYFTWSDAKDAKGQYSVNIYLSPSPMPQVSSAAKAAQQQTGKTATQSAATDGGTVDPPPPPPPPPPKMH